jgi:hypothetical protein
MRLRRHGHDADHNEPAGARSRMSARLRRSLTGLALLGVMLGAAMPVEGTLETGVTPGSHIGDSNFSQRVSMCFRRIESVPLGARILNLLDAPQTLNRHIIRDELNPDTPSSVTARDPAAASNGVGTGSDIRWNWREGQFYNDFIRLTPVDPCSELLHELVHSVFIDAGRWPGDILGSNVNVTEIEASRAQNVYLRAMGVQMRFSYMGEFDPDMGGSLVFIIPAGEPMLPEPRRQEPSGGTGGGADAGPGEDRDRGGSGRPDADTGRSGQVTIIVDSGRALCEIQRRQREDECLKEAPTGIDLRGVSGFFCDLDSGEVIEPGSCIFRDQDR